MIETSNMFQTENGSIYYRHFLRVFMAAIFLFGQSFSVSHAHEHTGETPYNNTCKICIINVSDDDDFVIDWDLNTQAEDVSVWWSQLNRLSLPEPKPAPSLIYRPRLTDPPPVLNSRADAARAPPIYI